MRAAGAVVLDRLAEHEKAKGLPVVAFGNTLLIGRNLVKTGDVLGSLHHGVQFGADIVGRRFQLRHPIEQTAVEEGIGGNARMADLQPVDPVQEALADAGHQAARQRTLGLGFGGTHWH
jgi:hypothetical protein